MFELATYHPPPRVYGNPDWTEQPVCDRVEDVAFRPVDVTEIASARAPVHERTTRLWPHDDLGSRRRGTRRAVAGDGPDRDHKRRDAAVAQH
jgi:hypothetical protein